MLFHFGAEVDRLAGDHEDPSAAVVNRSGVFPGSIDPGFEHLKDKEIVPDRHARIQNLAFEARIALLDERRIDS